MPLMFVSLRHFDARQEKLKQV